MCCSSQELSAPDGASGHGGGEVTWCVCVDRENMVKKRSLSHSDILKPQRGKRGREVVRNVKEVQFTSLGYVRGPMLVFYLG